MTEALAGLRRTLAAWTARQQQSVANLLRIRALVRQYIARQVSCAPQRFFLPHGDSVHPVDTRCARDWRWFLLRQCAW